MDRTVRAAVIERPHQVKTRHFPYPKLEDGDLLVKMEMSGICGSDKHSYKGESLLYAGSLRESQILYPVIPGHENVGVIAEISPKARREIEFYHQELKEGDRIVWSCEIWCGHCYEDRNSWGFIWCDTTKNCGLTHSCAEAPHLWGGWAEYSYLPAETFVYKVPDGIPPEVAVLSEPFACTVSLDKAKDFAALPSEGFCAGDTVVVLGLGPIGLLHAAKARILGAGTIIGIDRSQYRLDFSKQFSVDHCINAATTTPEERIQVVKDLTHGRGAEVVCDMVGQPDVLTEGLEMLGNGGVLIEEGAFVDIGTVDLNPHRHILAKNVRILGMAGQSYTHYYPSLRLMQRFGELYKFPFEKLVTHRYKIDEAEQAIIKSMDLDSMKVVIVP